MAHEVETGQPQARYSYGGDEFVFVELAEGMSMQVNFRAMAITNKLKEEEIPGIVDICPSNASYMVRVDPDVLHPDELIGRLKEIDEEVGDVEGFELETRVVDVPVMMNDPWTHEALMRFRDRHQDPESTDLEYSARINGYDSTEDFIAALLGSPWLVTMIGFVPGLPWCYQLVPPEEQVEVPKYVRPRTFTPERAFGFGGGFAVVYSVQGRAATSSSAWPRPGPRRQARAPRLPGLHRLPQARRHLQLPRHRAGGVRRDPLEGRGRHLGVPPERVHLPPRPLARGPARVQQGDPGGAVWRLGSGSRAS
nr:carboxyltransferase domain-containing protein [Rubrobacter marinus]